MMPIELDEAKKHMSRLIGQRLSHVWKGYGAAIFLELGDLQPRGRNPCGAYSIHLDGDWRIESSKQVVAGSSNSNHCIEDAIKQLQGLEISDIILTDPPIELCIVFGDGKKLRTMSALSGDPQWAVKLAEAQYLKARDGALTIDDGKHSLSTGETDTADMMHAVETARRWGTPESSINQGCCERCASFIYLDASFSFLDFGVCTDATSPFDGKVTNVANVCSKFRAA